MVEEYIKQAKKAKRERDFARAADFFYMGGDLQNALDMYLKDENLEQAAIISEEIGKIPEAIRLYEKSGNITKAAELSQSIQDYAKASAYFEKTNNLYQAAILAEQAEEYERAGRLYANCSEYKKAISCLTAAKSYKDALQVIERLMELRLSELKQNKISEQIDPVMSGYRHKAIEIYQILGNYTKAAELYLRGEERKKAANLYSMAGEYQKSFDLYMELGYHSQALINYEKSKGQIEVPPPTLAMLYLDSGKNDIAASIYEGADMLKEAAAAYEEAGKLTDAATIYNRLNHPLKASDLFLKSGDIHNAIDTLVQAGRLKDAAKIAEDHKQYSIAAEYYQKVNKLPKAAEMFNLAGDHQQAAQIFIHLFEKDKALSIFRANRNKFTDEKLLVELLALDGNFSAAAEAALGMGDKNSAAEYFLKGENYLEAAKIYSELNDLKQAGKLYLKAGKIEKAAQYFERTGLYQEAAECYKKLQLPSKSAECYERADNYFEAAQMYYSMKDLDRTINSLQNVPKTNERYRDASFMLGKIFYKQHFYNLAKIKLIEAINGQDISDSTIEAYYILAECHNMTGDSDQSIEILDKILSYDFHYENALNRRDQALRDKKEKKKEAASWESFGETSTMVDLLNLKEGDMVANRFRVINEVGSGGMGKVYKAYDKELEEVVAMKILFTQFGAYEEEKRQLVNEIKISRKISHPYIITVYDIGDWLGNKFFTMEFVEGINLDTWIEQNRKTDQRSKMVLIKKICEGLKAAHDMDIVHRDIKPRNIIIKPDGNPVILDFGIAEAVNAYYKLTTNQVMGSPDYMSPEQISDLGYDKRSDIYSIGCVMYEIFANRKPFKAGDITELFLKKLDLEPKPPSTVNSDVTPDLEALILKAMARDRKQRYSNIKELLSDINLNIAT